MEVWVAFGCQDSWRLPRSLPKNRHPPARRSLRKHQKNLPHPLQARPRQLLHKPRSKLGRAPQAHRRDLGAFHRHQHAPVYRTRNAWRHLHGQPALLQGQQVLPLTSRLQPRERDSYIMYLGANNLYGHAPGERFPLASKAPYRGPNQEVASQQEGWLHTRGGPGVPRGTARRAQRLPVGPRRKARSPGRSYPHTSGSCSNRKAGWVRKRSRNCCLL